MKTKVKASDLFNLPLDDYIKQLFDDDTIVYLHIPKAAGNSSISYIKDIRPKAYPIDWRNIDESWNNFIKVNETEKYDIVSGHFNYNHISKLKNSNTKATYITFIRHPIERFISQYKYMYTKAHPDHVDFREKNKDFGKWVLGRKDNIMSLILVGGARSIRDILRKIDDNYSFVGISDYYNTSMNIISTALDTKFKLSERKNVTNISEAPKIELSQKLYKELCHRHSLDLQLYNFYKDKYSKIADKLIGLQSQQE